MEYIRENIPLWSITIWDKKFNNVDKNWQSSVRKYKYLLADELEAIKVKNGDVKILYTGKDTGFTTEELAGDSIAEGEIVAIPWGGIPTVKYFKGKFVTGDNRIATSSDTSQLLNRYLYYFMKGNIKTIASFYRGASLKHPSMKDVLNMKISLPSIDEQNSIIKSLDCLERLIEGRKQELQKFDDLIKARFVELFNDKYDTVKIGDVFSTTSGGTPSKSHPEYYENGTIPWLSSGEVNIGVIHSVKNYITQEGVDNSSAKMVPENSVVIAMYGATAGQVGLLRIATTTNQAVCSVLPDKRYVPEYLYYAIKLKKDWMISQCAGGAQPNISQGVIKRMEIIDAPYELQKQFASFVEQTNKSKAAIQKSLDLYQELFDKLMNDYFGD